MDRELVVTDDRYAVWRGRWLGDDWYPSTGRPLDCVHCGGDTLLLHQRAGGELVATHPGCERREGAR